jgi:DNA-binding CsgD family transcriptional regulator
MAREGREGLLAATERVGHQGSWEWHPGTDKMVWSDNLYRLFGLEPQECEPTIDLFFSLIHPDDREAVRVGVEQWRKEGSPHDTMSYWVVRPDGVHRHLRVRTAHVSDGRMVGLIVDVTDQLLADGEIAAFQATSDVLSAWTSLERDGPKLLEALGRALGLERGILWVPDGGLLHARVLWQAPGFEAPGLEEEVAELRLARGSGVAGRAWEERRPIVHSDIGQDPAYPFRESAARDELRGVIAIPALHGAGVCAVVGLAGRHVLEETERFHYSLVGLGASIGELLSRNAGELGPRVLTEREVEILQLVADGLSGPQVAARLGIAPNTVKTHLHRIYSKLEATDRAAAVAGAMRLGVLN